MSLEGLFKAKRQQGILVPLLNEYLILKGKEPDGRATEVFHPSEISGFFCPRQWVIKERHRKELPSEEVYQGSERTFEIGHRLHSMMQDWFSGMKVLFGGHKCKGCHEVYYGFQPDRCECGSRKFKYQEVRINYPKYHIGGHTDGIAVKNFDPDKMYLAEKFVFEYKTMNPEQFALLRKPLDAHVEQACIYMYVLDRQREERLEELRKYGVPQDVLLCLS